MRIAYLDCFAGVSGDMFLGALLGAGVPVEVMREAVGALGLGALGLEASLRVETVDRSGISSIKVHVLEGGELAERKEEQHPRELEPHPHEHPNEHEEKQEQGREHPPVHAHEMQAQHEHDHEHEHERERKRKREHGKHTDEHRPGHEHPQEHEPAHSPEPPHQHSHSHSHENPHTHGRSLREIKRLIADSGLAAAVKARATRTFELLGHSEAKIHSVDVEAIHFHEVGAVDAIVDIVAASAGIEYLAAGDALTWHCSAVNVGGGMVVCAHGTFPVPAPATADLLRGAPTYSAHVEKELVTPTGAAILRALEPKFGPQPAMRVEHIGYGAGTRNPKGFPNVLRLNVGKTENGAVGSAGGFAETAPPVAPPVAAPQEAKHGHTGAMVTVLETALDDCSPQVLAYVAEQALVRGALDVMLTPVVMKKGRPGTLVTVLCNGEDASALEDLLLRETSTLGVRMHREHRACLERAHTVVETRYGQVRMKVGTRAGETLNAAPEYEDCRALAERHHVAVKQVMQAAVAAYSLAVQ